MKLLYITDTHLRGTPPQHRLDDFPAVLRAKLAEVVALAHRHQVRAILHGGDLFDRPDVAPSVAREFLAQLRAIPCPIYGIAGNHDLFGHNPETLGRTMLGLFDGFGLIRLLRPGQAEVLSEGDLQVQITGQEFHHELDRRDPRLDYCVYAVGDAATPPGHRHFRLPEVRWAIHLAHGMLLERDFFPGVAHTLLAAVIPATVADLTLTGHYHPGFSRIWEHGGRRWVNPGALARLGVGTGELRRQPQVVLIELTPTALTLEFVPLTCAPPGEKVLDRSALEAEVLRKQALADFLLDVRLAGDFQELELGGMLEKIADNQGVPPAVRAEALRRVGAAQELLARGVLDEEGG